MDDLLLYNKRHRRGEFSLRHKNAAGTVLHSGQF